MVLSAISNARAYCRMEEAGEYPRGQGEGYADIRERYIDPIDDAYALCLRISTCIANEFGAHG